MTYYYIAKRKPRGLSPRYVGDGLVEASSVKEAREIVSNSRNCPKKHIQITKHSSLTYAN